MTLEIGHTRRHWGHDPIRFRPMLFREPRLFRGLRQITASRLQRRLAEYGASRTNSELGAPGLPEYRRQHRRDGYGQDE